MNHEVEICYTPGLPGNSPQTWQPPHWVAKCYWCGEWMKYMGQTGALGWQYEMEKKKCGAATTIALYNALRATL